MSQPTEIAGKAGFAEIRYAQCWEDADVLLEAAPVGPGSTCLSVASAGDNTLAMVGAGAKHVIAADLSPAQIACLELRVAAYRNLTHEEFLQLLGQDSCSDRIALYHQCRDDLSEGARRFWDGSPDMLADGIAQGGRFEKFLAIFRRAILPLAQRRRTIEQVLTTQTRQGRQTNYDRNWNNRRWRLLCRVFMARALLGRFGRDPAFTDYADQSVWGSLQQRIPHALVELDPTQNSYLQWILRGRCTSALPWAWRAENFNRIRDNLAALEWRCDSIENVLDDLPPGSLTHCNLSDIFEYMSHPAYEALLKKLVSASAPGCRLVYWNVVVERSRPDSLATALVPLRSLAQRLHTQDKAFFYRDLVIEEVH